MTQKQTKSAQSSSLLCGNESITAVDESTVSRPFIWLLFIPVRHVYRCCTVSDSTGTVRAKTAAQMWRPAYTRQHLQLHIYALCKKTAWHLSEAAAAAAAIEGRRGGGPGRQEPWVRTGLLEGILTMSFRIIHVMCSDVRYEWVAAACSWCWTDKQLGRRRFDIPLNLHSALHWCVLLTSKPHIVCELEG